MLFHATFNNISIISCQQQRFIKIMMIGNTGSCKIMLIGNTGSCKIMMIGNTGSCKIVSNKRSIHVLYIYAGATRTYSCTLYAVASRIFPLVVATWSCSLSMSLCNLLSCSLPVVLAVDIQVYNLHGCLSGILYFRLNGEGATATISTLIYSAGEKNHTPSTKGQIQAHFVYF